MSDAAPAPGPFSTRAMDLLRRGPFARYMLGESISTTGTWMQQMAQGVIIAHLTDENKVLGWVNFAGSMPMLLLTMYGGTIADRCDKRLVLQLTQVAQIILAVGVGWLILTGQVQLWHIMLAAALLGISASFEMPSAAALVPEMVDKKDIPVAIAIDRAVFHGTRFVGPALAGYLIYRLGPASAFFANAGTFVALMLALLTIKPRPQGTAEEEEERSSGMKAGIDYVRGDRPTLAMLGLMGSASLCVFPFMAVMMPLYALHTLALDERHMGLLIAVSGVGSFVASVGLLSVPHHRRLPWMMFGVADVVLALSGLALAPSFAWACLSLVMLAVGTSFVYGLANTTVQERAPGPLRGRVSALAAISFVGIMPFAALGLTALADWLSIRTAMAWGAGVYGLIGTLIFLGPGRHGSELPAEHPAAVPLAEAS